MACKGICIRHKAQKPIDAGRYSTGQKRCQVCEIFLKWDDLWCPCCGYRLRTKPRILKFKAKLQARKKIKEYQLSLRQQYLPTLRADKKSVTQKRNHGSADVRRPDRVGLNM